MLRRLPIRSGIKDYFIKLNFPTDLYTIIRSYLLQRIFIDILNRNPLSETLFINDSNNSLINRFLKN